MSALRLDDPAAVAARFWPKVRKLDGDGCWLWTAAKKSGGYGVIAAEGSTYLAHRVAFALTHGECPDALLCHRCNTPGCVRPSHVYPGTHLDNARDRVAASGRHGGDAIENAWLEALADAVAGLPQREVAESIGVSQQTISKYLTGCCLPSIEAALNVQEHFGIGVHLIFEPPRGGTRARFPGRRQRVRSDKGTARALLARAS